MDEHLEEWKRRVAEGFPEIRIGDWVQAVTEVPDEGVEVARKGDLGQVIDKTPGCCPTVHWHRTGLITDSDPDDEFVVLCGRDFASSPETTPKLATVRYLRRGSN